MIARANKKYFVLRYKEDIALIKEMNCNALRLSLEWARIEPVQGEIDYDAIAR